MNINGKFVTEIHEFEELEKLIKNVFLTERELPQQVFQEGFGHYMFEEFDWAMTGEFWDSIKTLAKKTNDEFILAAVLEPNPIDYFFYEFGYYNWAKLPVSLSENEYSNILELGPEENSADAMLYNSDTVVWLSPSMKWAVWGERHYGICVLAFKDDNDLALSSLLKSWQPLNDVVISWVANNFLEQKISGEISNKFHGNYSDDSK
ncbi:hypothetical protein JOC78_001023 [Bacillus ectoiniformans]|uniref:hypothetical protein n=1 Tax=Bacillus ectoiniformans TaxID=1494429 RepID=UPI0019585C36|nr:hypothetical protein [Bacillus ectoiniformans]MBM7648083.1 hypothetical protein [Bacillus ectoiniformans]